MKKLIIAIAAVAIGVATNAATVSWAAASGYVYDGSGNTGTAYRMAGVDAYLFYATDYAQSSLVSDFYAGKSSSIQTSAADSIGMSNGRATNEFTSDKTSGDWYFVVFSADGKNLYVSDTAASDYDNVTGINTVTFGKQTDASKAFVSTTGGGYSGAGWYTQSVPEPTSGLLMLLGMAGLALRRKRA